ncbi:MAG: hypothetical protein A3G87_09120 [Omnitrophica bacterium RIFCSPLOWO2_12_FULL_50_11]|nr:MAG: hypothetical protein A3G87_09120 [Omnitrophica bacterium RIFCSPLOWO2_12_FULL_50_11]
MRYQMRRNRKRSEAVQSAGVTPSPFSSPPSGGRGDVQKRQVRGAERSQGSFALIFAVFLVVGFETVIAGNMFHMMGHQRQVQRQVHHMKVVWTGDAIMERTNELLEGYVRTEDRFPNVEAALPDGSSNVLGDDSDVTGQHTFSQFIENWYEGTPFPGTSTASIASGFKYRSEYLDVLEPIHIISPGVVVVQLPQDAGSPVVRHYRITVDLEHRLTQVRTQVMQEITITRGHLFDFSVFFNEDLEIAAGPDFTVQGPIFSNKNIYLANDGNEGGHTLTLKLADDFSLDSPEPYVIHSAENIYFWYKRAIGENYQLNYPEYNNAIAGGGLPSYYSRDKNPYELMTFGNLGTGTAEEPKFAPAYYYFFNRATEDGTWGPQPGDNRIFVESEPGGCSFGTGCQELAHPGKRTQTDDGEFVVVGENGSASIANALYPDRLLGGYGQYVSGSGLKTSYARLDYVFTDAFGKGFTGDNPGMNLSAAIDVRDPAANLPPLNPHWLKGQDYAHIEDGVEPKAIPIGAPSHPSGPHVLIEPLTETIQPKNPCLSDPPENQTCYPADTDQVKKEKFQFKAQTKSEEVPKKGLNLYVTPSRTCSEDLNASFDLGLVRGSCGALPYMFDYRLFSVKEPFKIDKYYMIEIDMGRVVETYPEMEIIYVHTHPVPVADPDPGKPLLVKIVNGRKLPQNGLTIATNGRLWIRGDYNTFDYSKGDHCTTSNWDEQQCQPPPAAVFSDSFGILSNDWSDAYGAGTATLSRGVNQDVTVNTAIATGILESQLRRLLTQGLCWRGYCGVEINQIALYDPYNITFYCDDGTYVNGKDGVSDSCEFYQDEITKVVYLNPKSTGAANPRGSPYQVVRYQEAMKYDPDTDPHAVGINPDGTMFAIPGDKDGLLPDCDPNPQSVDRWGGQLLLRAFQKVDLDSDGVLSSTEVQAERNGIQGSLGSLVGDGRYDARYDLDESGMVTVSDTSVLRTLVMSCDNIRIPIIATPESVKNFLEDWYQRGKAEKSPNWSLLVGMRPFEGVSYRNLYRKSILGYVTRWEWICHDVAEGQTPPPSSCPGAAGDGTPGDDMCPTGSDPTFNVCDLFGEAGKPECDQCIGRLKLVIKAEASPKPDYNPYHRHLYVPQYSGGLENLANLQENFSGWTLRMLGTFSALWPAKELKAATPAYWQDSYYGPPIRKFDFNESLRTNPPPGAPSVFSIKRERWKEKALP